MLTKYVEQPLCLLPSESIPWSRVTYSFHLISSSCHWVGFGIQGLEPKVSCMLKALCHLVLVPAQGVRYTLSHPHNLSLHCVFASLKKKKKKYMSLCLCATRMWVQTEASGVRCPGDRVPGSCEPPDVGTGN